jgi:hypothetical protein
MDGYRSQDISAASRGDTVYLSGSFFAPGIYEDANEYDWADLEVPADEFAEALCRAAAGVPWQRGPVRLTQQQVSVGTDSIYAPGRAAADLTGDRMALLSWTAARSPSRPQRRHGRARCCRRGLSTMPF